MGASFQGRTAEAENPACHLASIGEPSRLPEHLPDNILPFVKTVISSKGQIVLPAPLRDRDRIASGQKFEIERIETGHYLLEREPQPHNEGLVAWLLACPETGWFRPLDSAPSSSA